MYTYLIKVTLNNDSVEKFQYEANDIVSVFRMYEVDPKTEYARKNSVKIDCELIS